MDVYGATENWVWVWVVSVLQASACNTDTTPTQPHQISYTHRTKNNTTNVVIQQDIRQLLMMDILMSEICWVHKKWNKISSDIKLVFYSSTITMMHGPINIRYTKVHCLVILTFVFGFYWVYAFLAKNFCVPKMSHVHRKCFLSRFYAHSSALICTSTTVSRYSVNL